MEADVVGILSGKNFLRRDWFYKTILLSFHTNIKIFQEKQKQIQIKILGTQLHIRRAIIIHKHTRKRRSKTIHGQIYQKTWH